MRVLSARSSGRTPRSPRARPPTAAAAQLNAALRRAARMATHDWLVCLISDVAGADDGDAAARHAHLRRITTSSPSSFTIRSESAAARMSACAVFASGRARRSRSICLRHPARTASPRSRPTGARGLRRCRASARSRCCRSRPTATSPMQLRELIGQRIEQRAAAASGAGAMSGDPGSLANLRDLALPPAMSVLAAGAGLWIVAAGLFAAIAIAAWRAIERYRANAYRRAALAEIDAMANAGGCDRSSFRRDEARRARRLSARAGGVAHRRRLDALSRRDRRPRLRRGRDRPDARRRL